MVLLTSPGEVIKGHLCVVRGRCCDHIVDIHSVWLHRCCSCGLAVSWLEAHATSTTTTTSSPGWLSRGSPSTRRFGWSVVRRQLRWLFAFDDWLVVVVRLEVNGLSVDVVQHEDVVSSCGSTDRLEVPSL
jgi:hypothetical protein